VTSIPPRATHGETTVTLRPARILAALALLSIPAGLLGCATKSLEPIRIDAPALADAAIAGPGVDINNLRGNITLRIDDRATDITVNRKVRLDKDGPAHFDLELVASSVDVSVDVQDRGGLPAVAITTTSTSDPAGFFVDLDIVMPAAEGLRIRSGGGVIRVSNIRGAIDIESAKGTMEVKTPHKLDQPISMVTGGGDIYLVVTPDIEGEITMRANGGKAYIDSETTEARFTKTMTVTADSLSTAVNDGINPIDLQTIGGTIRMMILEKPMERVVLSSYRW
jgi:hypothetical protein